MPRILLVEDEPAIADTLVYVLESECHQVSHALTGGDGLGLLEKSSYDLVILDVGLPDMTGFDVCRKIREKYQLPIIFLTARDGELDRVLGLEIGGDDYVTKPFSPREVAARVRAILRRTSAVQAQPVESKGLTIDDSTKRVVCDGKSLDLTAHEFKLAAVFLKYPGQVFSRDQLLDHAWDDPGAVTDRTVDAHVKSLRAKLRAARPGAEEMITTRRGLGYAYSPEND
ncbi:MAG: two-component system response regulator CreB [Verrucomicrobia bacterium]|jgi:two-component system catabolic regulation response regulator CreB|nr:two-component system response regulator CreB [Verrucomicrobiota bacterium]|tara:strand:+ start:7034 stop:7717 length:684 start_codon:yes stop_codon:yes gene_type:complete